MAVVWFPSEFTMRSLALNRWVRGVYGHFRYFAHMLCLKGAKHWKIVDWTSNTRQKRWDWLRWKTIRRIRKLCLLYNICTLFSFSFLVEYTIRTLFFLFLFCWIYRIYTRVFFFIEKTLCLLNENYMFSIIKYINYIYKTFFNMT